MEIMWFRRAKRWPSIDRYQAGGISIIRAASSADIERLMREADARGWSATGRPEWLSRKRDQFKSAALIAFGTEGPAVWRCIATVILADRSGGRFTLDVSYASFDALRELDQREIVLLAHDYLGTVPAIDLDGHW
jgi:hypothetical protein